jgi:hypothetical protein
MSNEFINKVVALKVDQQNFPSIINKVRALCENPNSVAVDTGIPIIGRYYVNAGRHAILFDVAEEVETVHLRHIMNRAKLDKILKGKISA